MGKKADAALSSGRPQLNLRFKPTVDKRDCPKGFGAHMASRLIQFTNLIGKPNGCVEMARLIFDALEEAGKEGEHFIGDGWDQYVENDIKLQFAGKWATYMFALEQYAGKVGQAFEDDRADFVHSETERAANLILSEIDRRDSNREQRISTAIQKCSEWEADAQRAKSLEVAAAFMRLAETVDTHLGPSAAPAEGNAAPVATASSPVAAPAVQTVVQVVSVPAAETPAASAPAAAPAVVTPAASPAAPSADVGI